MGAAMGEPKPFASLGPMLLARKGTAKPAMRAMLGQDSRMAELSDEFDDLATSQCDLGWNDMGDGPVVKLAVSNDRIAAPAARGEAGKRRAFTLRLDATRHLKLRLASTMQQCSAQALVTEALDRFFESVPEIDAIAAGIGSTAKKS